MFSAWRYGDFLQRKQASKQFNESNDFQMDPGFYSGAVPLDRYLQTCLGSSGMGVQMGRQFFLENSGNPLGLFPGWQIGNVVNLPGTPFGIFGDALDHLFRNGLCEY